MNGAEVDDIAARALGAMILEATALALAKDGAEAEKALVTLSTDSGLVLEVAAAVLYATSFIAGVGDVPPEDMYAASLAWQPDEEESIDVAPAPADEPPVPARHATADVPAYTIMPLPAGRSSAMCEWCDLHAIGIVNNYIVCFGHTDQAAATEPHPEPPFRDENEDGVGEEE